MKRTALLLAAGRGERMAAGQNKVLLPLLGRPVLHYVLELWRPLADAAVLVVQAADRPQMEALTAPYGDWLRLTEGGATRAASVAAGLAALPPAEDADELIAVHDAARPLTLPADIAAVWQAATAQGAAVLAAPVVDTVRYAADGRLGALVPREQLAAMQTPQAFDRALLESAYALADSATLASATDDAALVQALGVEVACVWATGSNLKLTRPADLLLAAAVRKEREAGTCV